MAAETAKSDAEAARQALQSSDSRARSSEDLARALDGIRRENHLAPRIAAAFRVHGGGES